MVLTAAAFVFIQFFVGIFLALVQQFQKTFFVLFFLVFDF